MPPRPRPNQLIPESPISLSSGSILSKSSRGPATMVSSPCDDHENTAARRIPATSPQLTTSPHLSSSLRDAAAGRVPHAAVRNFPRARYACLRPHSLEAQTKRVLPLLSVQVRSAEIKHRYDCVTLISRWVCVGQPTALTQANQVNQRRNSSLSLSQARNSSASHPPRAQLRQIT